ncbi:telomerase inhibitor [Kalmusia sp. IMI 367209]|nr:telomerase inhibitor [Kalmusia sp. IMI 367209]
MGLAAPKNRSRISNDPQNTTWANNTTRFGHRILTSQGWTPGSSLGASDAAHAAHYTAASQSHIRVLLKDDNLGLGAKRGSERAENFGLAGLESVLGRLNGKIEEVKKEEERREKIQQKAYVYRKFGFMNFVSGGFLVGDKIEKGVKRDDIKLEIKSEPESSDSEAQEKKSKKRKRASEDEEVKDEGQGGEQPKLKRKKKSMNLREEAAKEDAASESTSKPKKEKKNKKDKKSKITPETSATNTPASVSEPLTDKARRKAEKRARKEEKKLKKALKRAAKEAARSNPATEDPSSESEEEEESTLASSTPATGTSTPASGSSGLTYNPRGMHAVRQRYIRQKKMASMDPQALKEIFMIKTPS